jgi:protein-S-isoprenylcysteine O-methyltransferase Ste14
MISVPVIGYLKRRFGRGFRFYRLVFNVVALATVTPICLYERSIETEWAFWWQDSMVALQALLLAVAFLYFFAGAMHYDLLQFIGISQIRDGVSRKTLAESGELSTTGVLGVIRHPWYAGAIIVVWARGLTVSTLITNIILTVYLIVGTYLEERKLVMEYGDKYRSYQDKVSMFIPYRFLKSKIRKEERIERV